MGVVTALGEEVETLWDALVAGRSGVRRITRFDTSGYDVHIGGECSEFDPQCVVDRKQAKRLDRFAQFALAAGDSAAKDCGIDFAKIDPWRVGAMLGSGIGGLSELEAQHLRLIHKGPERVSAFTIPKLMVNAASGHLSIRFGARGPSTAVASACASATNAMGDAMRCIQRGEADVMFTGGSEAALTPLGVAAFSAMHALSTRNDDPQRASRPFDRDRDGFLLSEGAGLLIFEAYEHARRRGANIYAEVKGFAASADAGHIAQPLDDGSGAARAMRTAITEACANLDEISYINAHATSTPLGDVAEITAIKSVFGDQAANLAISSTKGALGHLLGASGGVEAIATILAMRNNVIPPTANLDNPDPACDLNLTPLTARDCRINLAMSNSFGFGGHNAAIVFGRCED
jgi:3-oxoacyl-[acyl-carrier-protein] synthase II